MCIVRERRPAGFLDMKCQTCFLCGSNNVIKTTAMLCSLRKNRSLLLPLAGTLLPQSFLVREVSQAGQQLVH